MDLLGFVLFVLDVEGWGQVDGLTESGGLLCGSGLVEAVGGRLGMIYMPRIPFNAP